MNFKVEEKDHNCIFTFSREKMLFFSALLFLTDSKYPLCSFFIEKIFFLFIPTSFPLWRPHTQGSNTSFLNAMGPRRLSLLIVEGSGCRHRAYSPAPPNLHVYNCYQNCCGKIYNFFIKHYYTLCECFINQSEAGLTFLNFPQTFKTITKSKRNPEFPSWRSG